MASTPYRRVSGPSIPGTALPDGPGSCAWNQDVGIRSEQIVLGDLDTGLPPPYPFQRGQGPKQFLGVGRMTGNVVVDEKNHLVTLVVKGELIKAEGEQVIIETRAKAAETGLDILCDIREAKMAFIYL